jgi:hypothetical protein
MRSVQTEASTHDQRVSAPRVALAGTADAVACFIPFVPHPLSCPPSLDAALLSALSGAHRPCGTMRALPPVGLSQVRQVSPLTLHCLPDIPSPTTSCARTSLCQSPQRVRSVKASPSMSRLAATRRRIGFVILRAVRSLPAASHPASRRRSCLPLHTMRPPMAWTSTTQTMQTHGRTHRPARPGDPVNADREYWIGRSSRAMAPIGFCLIEKCRVAACSPHERSDMRDKPARCCINPTVAPGFRFAHPGYGL